MFGSLAIDLAAIVVAVLVLVTIANRINVPYPILLVLGGIGLGYVPGIAPLQMPPDIVLLVFLPGLLYWESVSAPTSELLSRNGLIWVLQLAFGLVVATTIAVAGVAHALIPAMAWGTALVLGAIVSSTDEVAFIPIVERVRLPRHVLATIENESLINDATSLVLYGIGVTAVVSGTFSAPHALGALVLSVAGGAAIGIVAGLIGVAAWSMTKDVPLQAIISLSLPYLAYLPAWRLGASAVLATVFAGFTVAPFVPKVLTPASRLRATGFWVTIVFVLNAFIFVYAGMQFRTILGALHAPPLLLFGYGAAIAATCMLIRLAWVFGQGLLPATNYPQHPTGADWAHVSVVAWSGMRGGVSLAAALAIPLETAAGPFPQRELIIFLTFCVMLGTLVLQGGTLPLVIRWLKVRDDGTDTREERIALAHCAKAALGRLKELKERQQIPLGLYRSLEARFASRLGEFSIMAHDADLAKASDLYRHLTSELLEAQRAELMDLTKRRKIDNTVMRQV
ncbi:MAG: Na+/H+ antiporter, partial [Candidatus Eremiobacteraeota bacterium]|nr:Na+/H+ antiporter [Candidatus Eremiobacteraeota bacterium]